NFQAMGSWTINGRNGFPQSPQSGLYFMSNPSDYRPITQTQQAWSTTDNTTNPQSSQWGQPNSQGQYGPVGGNNPSAYPSGSNPSSTYINLNWQSRGGFSHYSNACGNQEQLSQYFAYWISYREWVYQPVMIWQNAYYYYRPHEKI